MHVFSNKIVLIVVNKSAHQIGTFWMSRRNIDLPLVPKYRPLVLCLFQQKELDDNMISAQILVK